MFPPHISHCSSSRSQTLPQAERPPVHSLSFSQNAACDETSVLSHSPSAAVHSASDAMT